MRKEFDKAAVDKLWAETIPSRLAYVEKLIDGKDRFTEAGNATGEMHLFSTLHQAKLAKDDVLEKTPTCFPSTSGSTTCPASRRF